MTIHRMVWLVFSCIGMLALSNEACAQYNLRTAPAVPVAGQSFAVVFDEDECEDFLVQEPGLPPAFTVNGSEAALAVDRIENPACDTGAVTVSIPVQGLPAGNYMLRLVARAFEAPDITGTLQIVPLSVGQPAPARPTTIPAGGMWGWLGLASLMAAAVGWCGGVRGIGRWRAEP